MEEQELSCRVTRFYCGRICMGSKRGICVNSLEISLEVLRNGKKVLLSVTPIVWNMRHNGNDRGKYGMEAIFQNHLVELQKFHMDKEFLAMYELWKTKAGKWSILSEEEETMIENLFLYGGMFLKRTKEPEEEREMD